MIAKEHALSVTRQCKVVGISSSSWYYGSIQVSEADLVLMRLIDEIHSQYPFLGSRRIRDELGYRGHKIGRGQVRTLIRKMGIEALYRKPGLSKPHPGHRIYPYLLRGLEIARGNQVWASDMTYIPMAKGFCYLTVIMDWASRRVLAWRLSNTLDASFCLEALEEAMAVYGVPQIFNTDQGSQFTSEEFTETLISGGIHISMDGKGRWMDNIFVERLWKSVKYEEVYLKAYTSLEEARQELKVYFDFYNSRRRHQGLDGRTPDEVYCSTLQTKVAA
jgi:putative transposase